LQGFRAVFDVSQLSFLCYQLETVQFSISFRDRSIRDRSAINHNQASSDNDQSWRYRLMLGDALG
jgi:hypothetical protein